MADAIHTRRALLRAIPSATALVAAALAAGGHPARPALAAGPVDPDATLVAMGVEWERIRDERCIADAALDDCLEAAGRDYLEKPRLTRDFVRNGETRSVTVVDIDGTVSAADWCTKEVAAAYRQAQRDYLASVAIADARHGVPAATARLAAIDAVSDDIEAAIARHPVSGIAGLAVKLRVFARYAPLYSSFDFAGTLLETIIADAERCCAARATAIVTV